MTKTFECAPDYHDGMTEREWTLVYQTEQDTGSGLVDSLGAIIDYATHPRMSQRLIATLQGMQDRAAWVCLYAPDAVQEFIDELKAREVQPPRGLVLRLVPPTRRAGSTQVHPRRHEDHAAPDVVPHQ